MTRNASVALAVAIVLCLPGFARCQEKDPAASKTPATGPAAEAPTAPKEVTVEPLARDGEIQARLERILGATGWFSASRVRVEEGVVFLGGTAEDPRHREWATQLASSTQDVVAVVNKMNVTRPAALDMRPAFDGLVDLWTEFLRSMPYIAFGILILLATLVAARWTRSIGRRVFRRKLEAPLLQEVAARACAIIVLVLGLYIVLRVSGLTRLALTVVGGTGLLGLVIGIAFRDIAENFLASVLLSAQRPFRSGDTVQIGDVTGLVERLTVRSTILMTMDGNHAQIPNATVYKSVIRNFTSNPNRRDDFLIGIGFDAPIAQAQEVAMRVLANHPSVLADPEPSVLVDGLRTSTVDLRIYYWMNSIEHSLPKVRSSVLRLIKHAFDESEISMPDAAREVVFPRGVPLLPCDGNGKTANGMTVFEPRESDKSTRPQRETVATHAEGGLESEINQIEEQARHARSPEPGEDLLDDGHHQHVSDKS